MKTTVDRRTSGWKGFVQAAVLMLAVLSAPTAFAQCAGFSDVADDGPTGFCPSVEWVKNRGVTLGCGDGTTYCPQNAVIRLAMAAFMKRLGDALTPVRRVTEQRPGALDLDSAPVICQTVDHGLTGFPRTAYADATVSASATADVNFAADLVASTDGGATWSNINAHPSFGSAPANQYGSLSDVGMVFLAVNPTAAVRFGVQVSRGGLGGATDLSDSRCQVRVLIYSRTGTASPY